MTCALCHQTHAPDCAWPSAQTDELVCHADYDGGHAYRGARTHLWCYLRWLESGEQAEAWHAWLRRVTA